VPFAVASVRPIAFVRCGSLGVTDRYLTRTQPSLPREAPGREGASDCALHVGPSRWSVSQLPLWPDYRLAISRLGTRHRVQATCPWCRGVRRLQHFLGMPRSPIPCATRPCLQSRSRTSGA